MTTPPTIFNRLAACVVAMATALATMAQGQHSVMSRGGLIRTDTTERRVTLLFTAADFADGADPILRTLKKERVKGAFFLTGKFLERHPDVVQRMVREGHYVGSHSYGHLLYFPWDSPVMSVSQDEFEADMRRSYQALAPYGITPQSAPWWVPPYEHYNDTISTWAAHLGLRVLNYTPGSGSNADYTTPEMTNYRSSDTILARILHLEEREGLKGHLMLFHLGTHPKRTDKFYTRHLRQLIHQLKRRGYSLKRPAFLEE